MSDNQIHNAEQMPAGMSQEDWAHLDPESQKMLAAAEARRAAMTPEEKAAKHAADAAQDALLDAEEDVLMDVAGDATEALRKLHEVFECRAVIALIDFAEGREYGDDILSPLYAHLSAAAAVDDARPATAAAVKKLVEKAGLINVDGIDEPMSWSTEPRT